MKTVLVVIMVLIATTVFSAPYLVSDPPPAGETRTHYKITGWTLSQVAAQANGSLRMDVGTAATGTTNLTVASCATNAVWGELCSVAVPFALTRPSAPSAAGSLMLVP